MGRATQNQKHPCSQYLWGLSKRGESKEWSQAVNWQEIGIKTKSKSRLRPLHQKESTQSGQTKARSHGDKTLVKVMYFLWELNLEFTDKNRQVATCGWRRQQNGKKKKILEKEEEIWVSSHLSAPGQRGQ